MDIFLKCKKLHTIKPYSKFSDILLQADTRKRKIAQNCLVHNNTLEGATPEVWRHLPEFGNNKVWQAESSFIPIIIINTYLCTADLRFPRSSFSSLESVIK